MEQNFQAGIVLGLDEEGFPTCHTCIVLSHVIPGHCKMLSSRGLWESIIYDENTAPLASGQQPMLSSELSCLQDCHLTKKKKKPGGGDTRL